MKSRREFIKLLLASSGAYSITPLFYSDISKDFLLIGDHNIHFYDLPGKSRSLKILNERPINAETPAHLLNDDYTPNELFFVRNNGIPPVKPSFSDWKIKVKGESVKRSVTFTLKELQSKFDIIEKYLTLECGGNGRSEFNPPAKGNQWSTGAVGCAKWTGIRLRDLLEEVGIKSNAVYLAYKGKDTHLSGDPTKDSISRGVPIEKALREDSMIAWKMNDADLPILNGYPVRLVFGGWPASCSGKWLSEILIRDQVHDGAKMGGSSYRVPKNPVSPGDSVADKDMKIIESMPVKSLITYPKTGAIIPIDKVLPIAGKAWVGDKAIGKVEYSIDFGRTWEDCLLKSAINRNAWQLWNAEVTFPGIGYFEVWARATDEDGISQPMVLPGWNPKGYLNNACHRIAVKVKE